MTSLTSSRRKLPEPKFGFVILCPDLNVNGLKTTVNSLKQCYPHHPHLCVHGNNATKEQVAQMSEICETYKGKDTITSLINVGMKKTSIDWNVIIFAGGWMKPSIHRIFTCFVKDKKDILFPVVGRKTNFIEGSMNGIIINKTTFEEVGDLPVKMGRSGENELELIKTFWSLDAIDKGCTFKAILGTKIC